MTVHHFGRLDPEERIEFVDEEQHEDVAPRRRLVPRSLLTLSLAALFVCGVWFAYVLGTRHSAAPGGADVPLIHADERPMKVRPDHPGGMEIPDRDKSIYGERPDGATAERLLPPAETPIPRPAGPLPQVLVPTDTTVSSTTSGPLAAGQANGPVAPGAVPKGMRVQLGAMRSEELARKEWDRLKRRNGDLLGSLSVETVRADLGDKGTFFRIQAGPLPDLKEAERICDEMKRRNFGCNIVR
jgi:hypothetical protein